MTPLRQRMIEDLELRNYSRKTIQLYVGRIAAFAKFHGRSPEELGPEHIRTWHLHLVNDRKYSWSYINIAVCSLRFLYGVVLHRNDVVPQIPYGRPPKELPLILTPDEVARFIGAVQSDLHRMVLTTIYAAGLRISEAVRLRLEDIDSARMLLHVRQGKGRKDRLVPISPVLLKMLRVFWRAHRSTTWLFPGKERNQPISTYAVEAAVVRARRAVGKHVTPHTLRHCFATHLLEAGTNICVVQGLLGHSKIETTNRYNHVARTRLEPITSPLDVLPVSLLHARPLDAPQS